MTVLKYRKKPVVIEAIQHDGTEPSVHRLVAWMNGKADHTASSGPNDFNIHIFTLEGMMTASAGDWIIRGVQGEFYPCKPDIFEATYELESQDSNKGASNV